MEDEQEAGPSQDHLMREIAGNLPPSAVVFEILSLGSHSNPNVASEICYVGFDSTEAHLGNLPSLTVQETDEL